MKKLELVKDARYRTRGGDIAQLLILDTERPDPEDGSIGVAVTEGRAFGIDKLGKAVGGPRMARFDLVEQLPHGYTESGCQKRA